MNKILTGLLLLINFTIFAQVNITGKVVDKATQEPLEFAQITLTRPQSSDLIGAVIDSVGRFVLSAPLGTYKMQITYVDQVLYSKDLVVDRSIDLGVLEVENVLELKEVTVTGQKKVIEREIDRLVFHVENSSKASQGDALEVLRVTPGVKIQNDQITMIGKSNLAVMINGKIVQLSNQDLSNFLKSIASEDIRSIEVITTPPAKYEAAGNSGLINITLKEAKKDSWNAQVKLGYLRRHYTTGTGAGNFSYNKNKLSIASSAYYREGSYYQEQDDYAYFPDGIWYTSSPFRSDTKGLNSRLDVSYKIKPTWVMGGQYLYNRTDYTVTDAPYTPVSAYDTNEIIRYLKSKGRMDLSPEIHSINYYNEVTLDTTGRSFTLNLDYFRYNNPDIKSYDGMSVIENPATTQYYSGTNTNKQNVENFSAKLDVEYPLAFVDLSFGGKVTKSKSLNDIIYFNSNMVDAPVTERPLARNDFEYQEDIQALYFSANKSFNDKWGAQAGLRMEATETNAISNNLGLNRKREYVKFFPTVYISYKATENSTFNFNYSKRIERPQFFALNPNTYFINPFQTIDGNPFLRPAYIDNIEITHTYGNIVTKIYYSYEDNLFAQVPLPNPSTNVIRFTNKNYINTQRVGISENYIFDGFNWWTSNNSFDISYVVSKFNLPEPQADRIGINSRISSYNDFKLNAAQTFLLGVNYWYNLPGVNGIFKTKYASSFSLSVQYLFLNRNLNVSLSANDIFKTSAERTTTTVNEVYQRARYYYDSRSLLVSISYKFGNKDIKAKQHTTGNEDERNRTGN